MADDERTGSCPLCRHRDPRQGLVCDLCSQRLAARLWELRDLHALLPAALGPGQAQSQRVSGSREASLPLRVSPLDLAGSARREIEGVHDTWRDQVGSWSVAATLDSWVRGWAKILDLPLPAAQVPALVSWLSRHLRWALDNHPAIDEFADEVTVTLYRVRALLAVSRAMIHLTEACPSCGWTALRRDPGGGDVECGNCRRSWQHEQFERLAVVLADEGDAA
jgi:hypothetical protein